MYYKIYVKMNYNVYVTYYLEKWHLQHWHCLPSKMFILELDPCLPTDGLIKGKLPDKMVLRKTKNEGSTEVYCDVGARHSG